MSNIIRTLATVASLTLAAVPVLAVATGAHAQSAAVKVADLDLNSTQGMAAFRQRVDAAARAYCRDAGVTGTRLGSGNCVSAVRAELTAKVSKAQLAQAGQSQVVNR